MPRRLLLDFRDVFSDGFEFNYVRGDVTTEQGIARSDNLQMKGAVATVVMDGSTDIARETQKIKVLVVPELDTGAATRSLPRGAASTSWIASCARATVSRISLALR